jgi:hypothetical protein
MPFPYSLSGTYRGRVMLQYADRYYFIDMKKMFAGLKMLKEKLPALFDSNEKKEDRAEKK